jgi:hypothetical protein
MDMDLGLAIAILVEQRYHKLCKRLRHAGFEPDTNEAGHATNQRWRIKSKGRNATVDFLIPPTMPGDMGGRLRNLEEGFAAVITPGLELAFQDRRLVTLSGETLHHETASREVWVCEAGASCGSNPPPGRRHTVPLPSAEPSAGISRMWPSWSTMVLVRMFS